MFSICLVASMLCSCKFGWIFYESKWPENFRIAKIALDFINSLFDEELDDPEMIIIPLEPDAVSDVCAEIDDSNKFRNKRIL